MVYKYRITLAGLKGFFRVYLVEGGNSLYTFHKQIRSDLEFPMDQPILFKALDAEGQVVARYALMDIGYGAVDSVTIADTVKAGVDSFVYFYDIQNKKSVIITCEGEVPGEHVNSPSTWLSRTCPKNAAGCPDSRPLPGRATMTTRKTSTSTTRTTKKTRTRRTKNSSTTRTNSIRTYLQDGSGFRNRFSSDNGRI